MAEQQTKTIAITVKLTMNGFPIELSFDGTVDQLPAITKRLADLGAEPVATAAPAQLQKRGKVKPIYNGDGDPCCPVHNRKLSEGDYGLFCSAKAKGDDVADKKGYCGLKFDA